MEFLGVVKIDNCSFINSEDFNVSTVAGATLATNHRSVSSTVGANIHPCEGFETHASDPKYGHRSSSEIVRGSGSCIHAGDVGAPRVRNSGAVDVQASDRRNRHAKRLPGVGTAPDAALPEIHDESVFTVSSRSNAS